MANDAQTRQRPSWLDRVLDKIKPLPAPPHSPPPPPVDRTNWEHSIDAHKVSKLTVHDIGLIVFNETQSHADSDRANESLASAREKVAQTLINADEKYGAKRHQVARTASPIEPSARALADPRTRAA